MIRCTYRVHRSGFCSNEAAIFYEAKNGWVLARCQDHPKLHLKNITMVSVERYLECKLKRSL